MTNKTKQEVMNGVDPSLVTKSRKIARSTVSYETPDGYKVIRYHATNVLKTSPEGSIILNSGGYRTPTTKKRINDNQDLVYVYQDKSVWYVHTKNKSADPKTYFFFDGMEFSKNGILINPNSSDIKKETKATLGRINRYCKTIAAKKTIPFPSAGDCFYCRIDRETGLPIGDRNQDHLIFHLEENYIHGSIIMNALKYQGWSNEMIGCHIRTERMPEMAAKAVKRYLKNQLGIPQ